jgi:spore germination protein GerM
MTRLVLPKWSRLALVILIAAVIFSLAYLPRLGRRVKQLGNDQKQEEQTRRQITQPPILTATDTQVKTKLFFATPAQPGTLIANDVQLPLSADPVQRSKQLIQALIANAPSAAQRTIPADTSLLAFYLLPDGTAIADFSDALSTGTPSGILSEQLVVNSITQTLAASVPQIRRIKILLHGQEADTLAGHLDLTVFYPVGSGQPAPVTPVTQQGSAQPK